MEICPILQFLHSFSPTPRRGCPIGTAAQSRRSRAAVLFGHVVIIFLGAPSATGRVPWCNLRKRKSANDAHTCNRGPQRNGCVRGGETESAESCHTPACNLKTHRVRNQPPEWSSCTCEPHRCCSRSWLGWQSRRNRPKSAWQSRRAKECECVKSCEWPVILRRPVVDPAPEILHPFIHKPFIHRR